MSSGFTNVKIEMTVVTPMGKTKKMYWDFPIDSAAGEMVTFSSLKPIETVSFGKKKYKFKSLGVVTHSLQIIKKLKKEHA
jgi:hypothetical protein